MKKLTTILSFLLSAFSLFANPNPNLAQANSFLSQSRTLSFEENKGQITGKESANVHFRCKTNGLSIFLMQDGLAYQFEKMHFPEGYTPIHKFMKHEEIEKNKALQKQIWLETYRMDIKLKGINENIRITKEDVNADYVNYYNHNALNVRSYRKITYHDVYPNIDWVIYEKDGQIKYDFIVKVGGNPSDIQLETNFVEQSTLNADGSLTLKNRMGSITEQPPVSYQDAQKIATQFQLNGNKLSFSLADYNPNQTLIIDPTLAWATYFGGNNNETGNASAVDLAGNVFIAGNTSSMNLITTGGHQTTYEAGFSFLTDAFLIKFNALGVLQWATYYGTVQKDVGNDCAVDASGNVYLAGSTESSLNIAFNGHQNTYNGGTSFRFDGGDAFLVKFNAAGVRQWGTYYGGTGGEEGKSCAVDNLGNVYLAGTTESSTNIASGGYQNSNDGADAFLVKFNAAGVRQWGTYYGGFFDEYGNSCTVDISNNVYLAGQTGSPGITANGHQTTMGGWNTQDAFLIKFNATGGFQWSTYYGGSEPEDGNDCTTDRFGNVFLTGSTRSTNNIAFNAHQSTLGTQSDAFLVKFNAAGVRQWGTYYGGTNLDYAFECAVDFSGSVYMVGQTNSSTNIAFNGHQNTLGGSFGMSDAFLVKFNAVGVRQWGTYYGGQYFERGGGCAIDASTNAVYLVGEASSTDGIAYNGHQNTLAGSGDFFLAKFSCFSAPLTVTGTTNFCSGQSTTLTAPSNLTSYVWSNGSTNQSLTVNSAGTYTVTVTNAEGCTAAIPTTVNVSGVTIIPNRSTTFCQGDSVRLTARSNGTYRWSNNATDSTITIRTGGEYRVTVTNAQGCIDSASVQTIMVTPPTATITPTSSTTFCQGDSVRLIARGGSTYRWSNNATDSIITVKTSGEYRVTVTNAQGCSSISAPITTTILSLPTASIVASGATTFCQGDSVRLTARGGSTYRWSNNATDSSIVVRSSGTYAVTVTNAQGCNRVVSQNIVVSNPTAIIVPTNSITFCQGDSVRLIARGGTRFLWSNNATDSIITVKTSGEYRVTVTNALGCSSISAPLTTTVSPLPTASIVASGATTFCQGDSVRLTARGGNTYRWSNNITDSTLTIKMAGTYRVTVTSAQNCSATATQIVTVNPKPTVGFTQVITGGNVVFTNTSSAGTSRWYFGNVGDSTSTLQNPTFTYTQNGNYQVRLIITNAVGCKDSTTRTINVTRVGTNEIIEGFDVRIFPNPTSQYLYIQFDDKGKNNSQNQDYKLIITNTLGQVVHTANLTNTPMTIETSQWATGMYFINVQINDTLLNLEKVIKE